MDKPFQVKIASSGEVIDVAADSTIVEALAEAGIDVMVSCEQGICGTCLTGVNSGEPDHRDSFLTDDEHAANDVMTPCCPRALSELIELISSSTRVVYCTPRKEECAITGGRWFTYTYCLSVLNHPVISSV